MNQTEYFTEKIATLPEDVQEAIYASGYEKALSDIQNEYKLHIDQGQVMETLATHLMFGDLDAPGFINGMFNEAHISSSVAGDMLVKIDTHILKKIREYLEDIEEEKEKEIEYKKLLMSEEEETTNEISDAYAEYYSETGKALLEAEQELLDEGILPDGSNITDEMFAKEMGIPLEDIKNAERQRASEALKHTREWNEEQLHGKKVEPEVKLSEKDEILRELESPEKTFIKPLFTKQEPIKPITPPDHQLQNTHVETPYVEEILPESKKPEPQALVPEKPAVETVKKPTKITLSIDPYKEPIE
ncbi:MAG: hypothetical protein V4686_02095 [Patescibacteria group bacterium]